jgi:hypothetical protein
VARRNAFFKEAQRFVSIKSTHAFITLLIKAPIISTVIRKGHIRVAFDLAQERLRSMPSSLADEGRRLATQAFRLRDRRSGKGRRYLARLDD